MKEKELWKSDKLVDNTSLKSDVVLPWKEHYLWWQKRGLMYTGIGYGRKIPTTKMVFFMHRWYRVYCCIFSNSGTCFICTKRYGELTINDCNFGEETK